MADTFDLRLTRAKSQINDALGQRMPAMPQPMQRPAPQMQAQMIPGGAQVNAQVPMGQNQMQLGMQTQGMQPRDLMARYSTPDQSFGVNYQPQNKGVMATYGRRFQEGGLATSLRGGDDYDRDQEFVAAANEQMRNMVAKPFAKGGLASATPASMSDQELVQAFTSDGNNNAVIGEVNRRIKAKLLARFSGDEAAASAFLRDTNDPLAVLSEGYAKGGGAWTRKEGQNPEGGLNAAGRASLKAQGHDIKPPVSAKQAKKSPKAAARRKSFCARMSGMPGPMKDEKGRPTRKALSLNKWDC